MSVIPCSQNENLRHLIERYAEVLKSEAYKLGDHGLNKDEFYNSGIFRGSIERIRGQFSATMREKREFAEHILTHLRQEGFIQNWAPAGGDNRYDYSATLPSGKVAAIELKGSLMATTPTSSKGPLTHTNSLSGAYARIQEPIRGAMLGQVSIRALAPKSSKGNSA